MPRATAAAAPLPAGAMVGAAKASDDVDVTDAAVPVADPDEARVADVVAVSVAVSVAVLEVPSSSSLTTSLGGFCLAHLSSILEVHSLWPDWLPVFCEMHWLKSSSQMKVGMVWV